MSFLLMVTWLTHNQPPSNYQVPFRTAEACEAARVQVIKDAERIRQEMLERAKGVAVLQMNAVVNAPSASAVCVAQ